jgi:sugar phosphate isomerase/epimerase
MLREIRSLGFEYAELSHGIRISLLPGIFEAVDAGEIKISSLHNFCPLPMGVNYAAPNIFKFTAYDQRERINAFKHSQKTLETAARLKARAVVLHMGCIDMGDPTDSLLDQVKDGDRDSDSYVRRCEAVLKKRERRKEEVQTLAFEILEKLADEAEKLGLVLGIENRESLKEIPFEADFPQWMEKFNRPGVGYWHDCGHAQIKENLGVLKHSLFLECMAPRLAGMHIHDVEPPGHDHRPPGAGMIDFAALKPMIKPETIKVFELSPHLKTEEVQQGVQFIYKVWGEP